VEEKRVNQIDRTLFYKDMIRMSDKQYHLFRKGLKLNTSSLHACKKRRDQLKKKTPIVPLSTGFYLKPLILIKVFYFLFLNFYFKPKIYY